MKTFYAKDEKQRDDWVRYLSAAVVEEGEGQGSSKSGRRVQSPRQPQQQKKIKKIVRSSADKKYRAMESITMRTDDTSRRVETLISHINILQRKQGKSTKEDLERKRKK
eukprot:UN34542